MKTKMLLLLFLLGIPVFSQTQGFHFKAYLEENGTPYANVPIYMKFVITDQSYNPVYEEIIGEWTDEHGIFSVVIGEGTPVIGDFSAINWGNDRYYLDIYLSLDGMNYNLAASGNLDYVPYAKYADNVSISELDDLADVRADASSVFIGKDAGLNDDGDNFCTAVGVGALSKNEDGIDNTAIGYKSLHNNTSGSCNTAMGAFSLYSNTTGLRNTAMGYGALYSNTTGTDNTAIGFNALYSNTTGKYNTAIGTTALYSNTQGEYNTAVGHESMFFNTTGNYNTAIGSKTLQFNTTGEHNTAAGYKALYSNTTGAGNTAVGHIALKSNTTGNNNVAVGVAALMNLSSGSYNTAVGYAANYNILSLQNTVAIGHGAYNTANNQVMVGTVDSEHIGGYAPWTNISDGRLKKDVRENIPGTELIKRLRPVTYLIDRNGLIKHLQIPDTLLSPEPPSKFSKRQIGFIAQEVEQAANEVGFDFHAVIKPQSDRDHYALRYGEFVPVLVQALKEQYEEYVALQKQRKAQQETIKKLQSEAEILLKRIEALREKEKSLTENE
jgi:hypothetical protein